MDRRDANGMTLLMEAARHKECFEKMKECLARGADINAVDYAGNNALMHAIDSGQDGAPAKFLLNKGIRPDHVRPDGTTALILAALARNPEVIQQLLDLKVPLDGQNKKTGNTAFMYAAAFDDGWAVCKLVAAGADVETLKNAKGLTGLDIARAQLSFENFAIFEKDLAERREKTRLEQERQAREKKASLEQAATDSVVLRHDVAPLKTVTLRVKPFKPR
jgi:ankyrin repeat protein